MHQTLWILFIIFGLASLWGWLLVVHNVKKFTKFQNSTFFRVKPDQRISLQVILFLYGLGTVAILILIFTFLYLRYGF